MTASTPMDVPMDPSTSSPLPRESCTELRFSNLRGVRWRINLGILPSFPSSSVEELRRVAADSRRKYASLRHRLLIDPHLHKDGNRNPGHIMDDPLSQNPDSMWGRFFRNAELEKLVEQDLSRLYPENGSYFQTPACQAMLRRILLLWCLRHPEYGYRQGMHELLAPFLYVLHSDVQCLSQVRKIYEDHFCDEYDGETFPEDYLVSNYRFTKNTKWDAVTSGENNLEGNMAKVCSLDNLDPDIRNIILLNDAYGAEGELGVILSERFMEHDAYCMFDALMSGSHGVVSMADFFSPISLIGSSTGLPPVIEASSAIYHLLSVVDSSLHCHLVELGVEPQYFALRWLRVLFGREFCLDDLLVIWDEIFSSPNGVHLAAENDVQYNFKFLCSLRGTFISAMAVSMLLHLRSSLLATENATSCLQRLLSFPENINLRKLIDKAKSLQDLALDRNISPFTTWDVSDRNKIEIIRAHSLSSGSVSPNTPLSSYPDSYWEEKWRVLHKADELKKGSQSDSKSNGIVKGSSGRPRFSLSRTESEPSPAKSGSGVKVSRPSVRRKLLDDLSQEVDSESNAGNSNEALNLSGTKEPLSVAVKTGKDFPEDPTRNHSMERNPGVEAEVEKDFREEKTRQHITERNLDFMAEEPCLSGQNSSVFSTATSPLSVTNDHENDSEKSSVTSNSCTGDNTDETHSLDEQCCNNSRNLQPQDAEAISVTSKPVPANTDAKEKQGSLLKERKPLSGKFQWFLKFGRGGGEGNLEKGRMSVESRASGDTHRVTSASGGCSSSCGSSGRAEVGDKKGLSTMRNLGQSMLENIKVIESALQQDRCQVGTLENTSETGKGSVAALAALKELRKISYILLSEM